MLYQLKLNIVWFCLFYYDKMALIVKIILQQLHRASLSCFASLFITGIQGLILKKICMEVSRLKMT